MQKKQVSLSTVMIPDVCCETVDGIPLYLDII
jgi:hypothetical protein